MLDALNDGFIQGLFILGVVWGFSFGALGLMILGHVTGLCINALGRGIRKLFFPEC